ncbi:HAD family hydrolase [[Clostridium] polysaccharolyticum]|uniref:Phosphoglycolate phosphatase n=1 Tax=[Clostridium] polysaccharolyticum TaxID=29364 RepID=A0A1I0A9J9_9FIRM|nr:HAD-IIIA family hydrolase [[Clostridium] polysaccharolyticum]SES90689.1 phosphoglycolate phosphatase [[Clostridium] polysaccharolyticum]
MKNYKLLIFDLDGTILETLEDLTDSTNVALKSQGFPEKTMEQVRSYIGNGIYKLLERAVPKGTEPEILEKVYKTFKEYYRLHCADKTKPYDGMAELLTELKKNGHLLAVVSNKADFAVQSLCKEYFGDLFDYTAGEREGVRRKPYPDSILEVLKVFHVEKEHAVYIGDSEVDIQVAKNAGIDEIAVAWGYRDEEFLMEQGARVIVKDVKEIGKIV